MLRLTPRHVRLIILSLPIALFCAWFAYRFCEAWINYDERFNYLVKVYGIQNEEMDDLIPVYDGHLERFESREAAKQALSVSRQKPLPQNFADALEKNQTWWFEGEEDSKIKTGEVLDLNIRLKKIPQFELTALLIAVRKGDCLPDNNYTYYLFYLDKPLKPQPEAIIHATLHADESLKGEGLVTIVGYCVSIEGGLGNQWAPTIKDRRHLAG